MNIDERPAIVDTRQRLGDWEVDTIIGKGHRHAIVSLTERKSRLALLRKVERKTCSGRKWTSVLENVLGYTVSATITVLNSYSMKADCAFVDSTTKYNTDE